MLGWVVVVVMVLGKEGGRRRKRNMQIVIVDININPILFFPPMSNVVLISLSETDIRRFVPGK